MVMPRWPRLAIFYEADSQALPAVFCHIRRIASAERTLDGTGQRASLPNLPKATFSCRLVHVLLSTTQHFSPPLGSPHPGWESRAGGKNAAPLANTAIVRFLPVNLIALRLPWRWEVCACRGMAQSSIRAGELPDTYYLIRFPASVPALAQSDPTWCRSRVNGEPVANFTVALTRGGLCDVRSTLNTRGPSYSNEVSVL